MGRRESIEAALAELRRRQDGADPAPGAPRAERKDCVFRGADTGRTVDCPTCAGHVALKLFACSQFGECTLSRKAEGKACCNGCTAKRRPHETPPAPAEPAHTRHLLYHVYPRAGSRWRERVLRLRERIELFNGRRVVAVAFDGTTDPAELVADALAGTGAEIVSVPNDPNRREAATFRPLFDRVADLGPGHAVLYAHAKGVTRPEGATCHRWAQVLEDVMLDYWPAVSESLLRHPLTGAFKKLGRGWPAHESRSDWHYSGSWFWFRPRDLFARDWTRIDRFWGAIEPYPSLHFRAREAGSLFGEGRVPELNLYSHDYWHSRVEPELVGWRAANTGRRTAFSSPNVTAAARALNLGCGPHYFPGWVNVDVVRTATIRPDVLADAGKPLPFAAGSFDRAYLGHVLEHVPWPDVVALLRDVKRTLAPGAEIVVVGPDLKRALAALRTNPDEAAALSHVWEIAEERNHYQKNEPEADWPAARHHWNCYAARVAWALAEAGFADVREEELTPDRFGPWPVVDYSNRSQCAVTGRA